jgi:phage-related protein
LLPILQTFLTFINENALPAINAFSNAFSLDGNGVGGVITTLGDIIKKTFQPIVEGLVKAFNYVKDAIGDNLDAFKEFGGYIAKYLAPIIGEILGGALTVVGKIAAGVIDVVGAVIRVLNSLISGAITGINALISAYNFVNNIFGGKDIAKISAPSISIPKSTTTTTTPKVTIPNLGDSTASTASNGITTAAKSAAAASSNVVNGSFALGSFRAAEAASSGTTINLTVTGAFEPEGTARTIIDTLNNSYYRGTGGGSNLQGVA